MDGSNKMLKQGNEIDQEVIRGVKKKVVVVSVRNNEGTLVQAGRNLVALATSDETLSDGANGMSSKKDDDVVDESVQDMPACLRDILLTNGRSRDTKWHEDMTSLYDSPS